MYDNQLLFNHFLLRILFFVEENSHLIIFLYQEIESDY